MKRLNILSLVLTHLSVLIENESALFFIIIIIILYVLAIVSVNYTLVIILTLVSLVYSTVQLCFLNWPVLHVHCPAHQYCSVTMETTGRVTG